MCWDNAIQKSSGPTNPVGLAASQSENRPNNKPNIAENELVRKLT